jgi:hypothetical protein
VYQTASKKNKECNECRESSAEVVQRKVIVRMLKPLFACRKGRIVVARAFVNECREELKIGLKVTRTEKRENGDEELKVSEGLLGEERRRIEVESRDGAGAFEK